MCVGRWGRGEGLTGKSSQTGPIFIRRVFQKKNIIKNSDVPADRHQVGRCCIPLFFSGLLSYLVGMKT